MMGNWEEKIRNERNMLAPAVYQCGGDEQPLFTPQAAKLTDTNMGERKTRTCETLQRARNIKWAPSLWGWLMNNVFVMGHAMLTQDSTWDRSKWVDHQHNIEKQLEIKNRVHGTWKIMWVDNPARCLWWTWLYNFASYHFKSLCTSRFKLQFFLIFISCTRHLNL